MHTTSVNHLSSEFIKIRDVAEKLDISKELVYRLIKEKQLKAHSFGRKCLRIHTSELAEYIKHCSA